MNPRSEFFVSVVAQHPNIVWVALLSLMLCLSVFLLAVVGKRRESYTKAALLPLREGSDHE